MAWRDDSSRAREEIEQRLLQFGDRWRLSDAGPPPGEDTREERPRRVSIGLWSRPALRGLLLLVLVVSAIAGYLFWQGRPAEIVAAPLAASAGPSTAGVEAPEILATGAPLTGGADPAVEPIGSGEHLGPPQPVESVEPVEPVLPVEVVVHVAGLVARPGLVRLPAGSRVADAIEQAGGVTRRRAADSINLARILVDGEQILVLDVPSPVQKSVAGSSAPAGAGPGAGSPSIIDLNVATIEMLDALPGVGPVLAGRILDWRTTHGRFRTVDELGEVSGIGDAILEQLRPLVRV